MFGLYGFKQNLETAPNISFILNTPEFGILLWASIKLRRVLREMDEFLHNLNNKNVLNISFERKVSPVFH